VDAIWGDERAGQGIDVLDGVIAEGKGQF